MEREALEPEEITGLEILSNYMGERIDPMPPVEKGKLVLWYGSEWVEYDEHDESQARPYGMSRYPAGAYFQTIALRPEVIQEPKYIADASLRVNQSYTDEEFVERVITGMFTQEEFSHIDAMAVLLEVGEEGKAGCWPADYDPDHFESELSEQQVADFAELDKGLHEYFNYIAHLVPMEPEGLGMAIAKCVPGEWLNVIGARMTELLSKDNF